jgi:hypothetical protein
MSRYAQCYYDVEPMDVLMRRIQYRTMMAGKSNVEQLGAQKLAEYRSRRAA